MGVWVLPYSGVKLSLLQLIGEEVENIYRRRKDIPFCHSLGIDLFKPLAHTCVCSLMKEEGLYRQLLDRKHLFLWLCHAESSLWYITSSPTILLVFSRIFFAWWHRSSSRNCTCQMSSSHVNTWSFHLVFLWAPLWFTSFFFCLLSYV